MNEIAWYYASSEKATFGFEVANGRVVATAPYSRKWLVGKSEQNAIEVLRGMGYKVVRGDR